MSKLIASTIDLFKVVVAQPVAGWVLAGARHGFITDFVPTAEQIAVLKEKFKGLPIVTLFTVEERNNATLEQLLWKQILHYIEVYGLGMPGLFGLEVEGGKVETIAFIRAVSKADLERLVQDLLYSNRPVGDSAPIIELIRGYNLDYDINKVKNNELKVALFDLAKDTFTAGDDAVRYLIYAATAQTMLIKSEAIIAKVRVHKGLDKFLAAHMVPLAKVFNRHKRIIMALKTLANRGTINRISHLSKKLHVPMVEPISKRFVSGFVKGTIPVVSIDGIPIRDKFKYLNLIEWKLQRHDYDTFTIRNGKVWFEKLREVLAPGPLVKLRTVVLESLARDLKPLKAQNILLDPSVDYGLPISRKQVLGNLPFGTRIASQDQAERFSAGVYWHNNFGDGSSIDLDLTAIDDDGERTGWGGYAAYTGEDIIFSGDITSAPNGATEFMTVNPARKHGYGLMVNIFQGPEPCDCEIVVGTSTSKEWLETALIRERISLASKQMLIGFLKDDAFIVYSGRLSNDRISDGKHPIIDKGLGRIWTLSDLLIQADIDFDLAPRPGAVYDHDLRYAGFSLDKLEKLLGA